MATLGIDRLDSMRKSVVLRDRNSLLQYRDRVQCTVTAAYRRLGPDTSCVCGGREMLASKANWKTSAQLVEDRRRR